MQDITVFCNYSCSVPTDTFGLYCSVNRQDMKLDRVSVFCYSKRCRLRVKMQCNSQHIRCMYLPVVTKRNTLMFSVWCQSKLLTADSFCIELSGDVQFKPSIAGRILPNCETLRLSTGTVRNARRVLELHDIQFLQMPNLYKTLPKLNLQCNICLSVRFAVQFPPFQYINNKYFR